MLYTFLALAVVIILAIIGLSILVTNKAYSVKEQVDPLPEIKDEEAHNIAEEKKTRD